MKNNQVTLQINRKTRQKTNLAADVRNASVRKQLQYAATLISASRADLDEVSLSNSTLQKISKLPGSKQPAKFATIMND